MLSVYRGGVKSAFWSKRGPMVADHYKPGNIRWLQ